MINLNVIILLAFIAQALGQVLVKTRTQSSQGSKEKVSEKLRDMLPNKLVSNKGHRALKVWSLRHADVDDTTVALAGNLPVAVLPPHLKTAAPRATPFLRASHSRPLQPRSRAVPGTRLSKQLHLRPWITLRDSRPRAVPYSTEGREGLLQPRKPEPSLPMKLVAEFAATFLLVQLGCGVVCSAIYVNPATEMLPAIWGFIVAICIYATRDISGAHFNPAITLSLAINKDFPKRFIIPYILAQTLGAFLAGVINYIIWNPSIAAFEAAKGIVRGTAASTASFHGAFGLVPQAISAMAGFGAEVWMTAVLAWCVFALTDPNNSVPNDLAPLMIGALVTTIITVFSPFTGCGMNPARDIGPRLVTMMTGWGSAAASSWWVFTLGPIIGAILGGAAYQAMFPPTKMAEFGFNNQTVS